ncbi:uncharacterized protein MAM_04114 [Metarhizium album ARSEF 1941]|uniref:Uncharacterized protein n=1 Tax=Metarhizium album (strain ARSEF 1941) TaxID=1081103 RepID=A0A0B2WXZ8_METAS|nr:uncharacterized protein MAM_04114 [Metarhizium album ARSEF 1941]KHN97725.1 hypothetical protein MAM_04114 [Metarhizium album ARSEF 1941]
MATPNPSKRRFVPVPIETTFQSNRKSTQPGARPAGPNPELTPEPSPRSASPPMPQPRQRRRFKPQLIETSRRARRAGDPGPATRPADKTDITPYTNHIYAAKPKPRRKHGEALDDESIPFIPPTRRESEEEGVKEYLLEIAAREAARQMEEAALAAFPNSRAREGGVAHFYFRESSESDDSAQVSPQNNDSGPQPRVRRKSSNLGLNWWHKHMQSHAEQLAHERGDDEMVLDADRDTMMRTDSDLDRMDLPVPPDPLWTTTNRILPEDRRDSMPELQDLRDSLTPLSRPDGAFAVGTRFQPGDVPYSRPSPDQRDGGFSLFPRPADSGPDIGFGRPFGAFGSKAEDPKLHLMRQAASPPMLGKSLIFRQCPSPKQTKLETDHPFANHDINKKKNRDVTGQGGLWRGFCCRTESSTEYVVPADLHGANMLVTPYPPASPRDGGGYDSRSMSDEPESMFSSSNSSESLTNLSSNRAEHRPRTGESKGLHMLHGLDDRLRREKAQVELDEKIASEFDDEFVTQVYNYLSLGYPATARYFDGELSKISRVTVEELCRDDERQRAKGHMLEMNLQATAENDRCPRWKALRTYITEWARQHPDLDNLDPLAWGVRERRGSWAI